MTVLQTAQSIIAAGNQDSPHVSLDGYKVASALIRAVELLKSIEWDSFDTCPSCCEKKGEPHYECELGAFLAEINKETT